MSKYEKFVANAMKMKVDNDKNIMLGGLGDKLKEQIMKAQQAQKEDQKEAKPMTKFERFAANAMKIKVQGEKKKILNGVGNNLMD